MITMMGIVLVPSLRRGMLARSSAPKNVAMKKIVAKFLLISRATQAEGIFNQ